VFRLSKISLDGVFNRLKYILNQESIQYDEDAVMLIAKLAGGGMRDAITMLDKVLSYSNEVKSESVELALNLPNYEDFFNLLGAYAKHDNAKVTEILDTIYNSDSNFINWIEAFQAFVTNVMKYVYLRDINRTTIPSHYNDKLSMYSEPHALVCLKLSNTLLQMMNEIKDSRYQLEIALSYLCVIPKQTKKGSAGNA
jgi:DNA polymerase-3 subunit gamma/tau